MARVLVATQPWGVLWQQPAADLIVKLPASGTAASINTTVYSASTGNGTVASFVTNNLGELPGYVEEGSYTLTVGGSSRSVEATSGTLKSNQPINARDYGVVAGSTSDQTSALQSFFDAAAAAGRGFINASATTYRHAGLTIPSTLGAAGGCIISGAGPGAGRTQLEYTGAGHGITFGDGAAFETSYQALENVELIGNAAALSAVRFNSAKWCKLRHAYVHGYTKVGADAVVIDANDDNYFNEIADVWFADNYRHIALYGDATGIGANSNRVKDCTFSVPSGDCGLLIDGGDTNRIVDNEFDGAHPVAVKVTGVSIYNTIARNQFDGPTKAWELGASATQNQLIANTGAAATLNASTDSGTANTRDDIHTQAARVSVYGSAGASVPTGAITTLAWGSEEYDPHGMHAADASDLTAPMAGTYHVTAIIQFTANATGVRMARVTKNGDTPIVWEENTNAPADGTSAATLNLSFDIPLAKNDFLRCRVYQTSGVSLTVVGGNTPGSRFQMRRVSA